MIRRWLFGFSLLAGVIILVGLVVLGQEQPRLSQAQLEMLIRSGLSKAEADVVFNGPGQEFPSNPPQADRQDFVYARRFGRWGGHIQLIVLTFDDEQRTIGGLADLPYNPPEQSLVDRLKDAFRDVRDRCGL